MDPLVFSTVSKLGLPTLTVALVLFASKKRGLSWRDDLGFRLPKATTWMIWLALWVLWLAISEVLIRFNGLDQAKPWPEYPAHIMALRVVAIGLLGPLAEEVLMRGMVLHLLRRTLLGAGGAIVIAALAWAAMHYSYGIGTVALIAADGVILGLARYRSGSLWVPISMHMLGNLFSISQSLTG
jgi:membrane protease YdiL (CAAX protease family)